MTSKTWKLGEVCRGGIIQVITTKSKVTIIGKDWDTSQGYNKGSNQSNAKEWTRKEMTISSNNFHNEMMFFLEDLTTHYYASKIMEWIESKVDIKKHNLFGW